MPELDFAITGVEAEDYGMTPLLSFKLRITNATSAQPVQALALRTQIQFECPWRSYQPREKERLSDLFGAPERWGETLRNRLWTHVHVNVGGFAGSTEVSLPVPCSFDLNVSSAKYFHALEEGDVSLLFLFSGTVFYLGEESQLQIQQVSWEKEARYRMAVQRWRQLMDLHYPNQGWLYLERDTFNRLYDYRRRHGLANWDQAIERLLPASQTERKEAATA